MHIGGGSGIIKSIYRCKSDLDLSVADEAHLMSTAGLLRLSQMLSVGHCHNSTERDMLLRETRLALTRASAESGRGVELQKRTVSTM